ncbi:SHOCT domain-containing protein [Lactiplantibacillus plantarum]|uniref:SHOCT domain-containing protein n=1 Tax=Lactiplantibacillus plantarum TaxID=1590 RepID=UPI003EBBFBE9
MAVVLYFNNNYSKQLNYISTETKIDSMYYRDEQEKMQRFCVRLDKILVENENNEPTTLSTPTNSADELRKLKSLLDDGILTEEEFAAKKKQILGILSLFIHNVAEQELGIKISQGAFIL